MAYKTTYESKGDIPEGLEPFFTERDGTFRFDANDYETDGEVQNLKKALRKERDSVSTLEGKLKALPDDFDAEKWDALKHVDPEDINKKGDEALLKQIDNLKDQVSSLKGTVQEKETALEEKEASYRAKSQRSDIESALASVISDKYRREDALDRIMRGERITTVDDNGIPQTKIGDLDKEPEEFVKSWVDSEVGKRYADADSNHGGGSRNNGSVNGSANPFEKGKENLTKQGELIKNDPQKAKQLAANAGVELNIN